MSVSLLNYHHNGLNHNVQNMIQVQASYKQTLLLIAHSITALPIPRADISVGLHSYDL
jgi:hypothetical protein